MLSPDICECLFFEKILEYDTLEILSIETLHMWCVIVYEVNLKKITAGAKAKKTPLTYSLSPRHGHYNQK